MSVSLSSPWNTMAASAARWLLVHLVDESRRALRMRTFLTEGSGVRYFINAPSFREGDFSSRDQSQFPGSALHKAPNRGRLPRCVNGPDSGAGSGAPEQEIFYVASRGAPALNSREDV